MSARFYKYETAKRYLTQALEDLSIIAGDSVGPSDASWQDVAGTATVNLRCLADQLDQARVGNVASGPVVFPSPAECLEGYEGSE